MNGQSVAYLLLLAGVVTTACATRNVFNNGRALGYSVDFVSAEPVPGAELIPGDTVKFTVTVRYDLQVAEAGRIVLVFQDEEDQSLNVDRPQASVTVRKGSGETTLADELTVPPELKELQVYVPLRPQGVPRTSGEVVIRYPVRQQAVLGGRDP